MTTPLTLAQSIISVIGAVLRDAKVPEPENWNAIADRLEALIAEEIAPTPDPSEAEKQFQREVGACNERWRTPVPPAPDATERCGAMRVATRETCALQNDHGGDHMSEKRYLGDSVYVDFDGCGLVLTTENGERVSDTIYLGPELYAALVKYVTEHGFTSGRQWVRFRQRGAANGFQIPHRLGPTPSAAHYYGPNGIGAATGGNVPPDALREARPKIVCLCGSTRFKDAYDEANYQETMAGRVVLSVGFFVHATGNRHGQDVGATPEQKIALDELHLRKIDLADEAFVLNVGGYIGESTRNEIAYAERHGKAVRYLESVGRAALAGPQEEDDG